MIDNDKLEIIVNNEKEWRAHIIRELEWFKAEQIRIQKEQIDHGKDIARLQIKSGIWGCLGGSIIFLIAYLKSKI